MQALYPLVAASYVGQRHASRCCAPSMAAHQTFQTTTQRFTPLKSEKNFEQRLQAAALELFWEKGYRGTSTRDIAAALGVKQGSLYYYVKNKEDVLYAICYASLQHVINSVMTAAASEPDPLASICLILETHLRSTLEQRKPLFVSIADYRSLSAERVEQIKIFWRDYQTSVSSLLDAGKANGSIRKDLSDRYLYLITMSTINWMVLWFRPDRERSPQEFAPLYSEVLIRGAATPEARQSARFANLLQSARHPTPPPIDIGSNPTHARLLDTASTLFARRGFSNTSVREIAEAVGIEKASLYHYLNSKEELSFEISRAAHLHLSTGVQMSVDAAASPEERLFALIATHVTCLLQHQDWHATANERLTTLEPARRAVIIGLRDAYEALVRATIADAQTAGFLRADVSPKWLSMILLGMMTHIYPWYEPGKDLAPAELGEAITRLFLTGLKA